MRPELQILFEEPAFTIGLFENALVWCFRGEVTLDRIKWAIPAHKQLVKKYPNGISVTTIIAETVPLSMPADARNLSTVITKEHEPYYCCVSEVVPGTGFRAATVRSITAGIRIIARSKFPAKVFADVTTAANWHAPLMSPHVPSKLVDPGDLGQAAERVRLGPS